MKEKILMILLIFSFLNYAIITNASLTPAGFGEKDAIYTLEGDADLFLVDKQGRETGYKNGKILEDIPGVNIFITAGGDNNGRKQIYMSERKDVTAVIVGKSNSDYNLLVAGGNYYLKIQGVQTDVNQIDEIISKPYSIELNFYNNKKGNYNLMMNNYDFTDGTIFYPSVKSVGDIQKYLINWDLVSSKKSNAVKYIIEKDNSGDINSKYGILYYDSISVSVSGPINPLLVSILIILFIIIFIYLYRNKKKN